MRRVQNEVDEAKAEVRNDIGAMIKILKDHESALIAGLDVFLVGHKTTHDEVKNEVSSTIQDVTKLRNQCQSTEEQNLEHFILEGHEKLQDVCKRTRQTYSILSTKPVKRNSCVRYIPNPEVIPLLQDLQLGWIVESVTDPSRCTRIESLNKIRCGFINQFSIVTKNSEGDLCYTNPGSIEVQIQDVDGNEMQKELTDTQTGRSLVKYKAEKPLPYKVVVNIGGKEISNSPQNVETIDAIAELKPERFFGPPVASALLCSLAIGESGEIAVVAKKSISGDDCTDSCVYIFSADGEYLREFGGQGTPGDGQLIKPIGIVFSQDTILVSDYKDGCGCIKEFGHCGTYKRTLCRNQGMDFSGLYKLDQNVACLCYTRKKGTSVKFYGIQTVDLLQEIKLDIPNDWLPWSLVCVDNKYFVSFPLKNKVCVFDDNGCLLYTFGEKGNKEGQFDAAGGLTVFGEDTLLVCDRNNHRVQVFTQEGQFVRSFGSHGSGLGQMNTPLGVLVTPDGRVLVVESVGKRVQVWR